MHPTCRIFLPVFNPVCEEAIIAWQYFSRWNFSMTVIVKIWMNLTK